MEMAPGRGRHALNFPHTSSVGKGLRELKIKFRSNQITFCTLRIFSTYFMDLKRKDIIVTGDKDFFDLNIAKPYIM